MTLLLLTSLALAQQYAFPTSADDYSEYYPTAYFDHGGNTDWACSNLTYSGHGGSDFGGGSFPGMDAGRDVTAAAPGVVVATNDGEFDRCVTGDCYGGGGFGNYVYVQHGDGRLTIYAHLKTWSLLVAVGDDVGCGDKLGEMGSSGYSTGPHLHFQVEGRDGGRMDPFDGACDVGATEWVDQGVHGLLPALDCDLGFPACPTVETLGCGAEIDVRNDDPGSTTDHFYWGCTDFQYSGPELAWNFATDIDEPVTVRVTGLSSDLDLFAIGNPACDGRGCLEASTNSGTSDEEVVFQATAGSEYGLVVDGWEGAVTGFHLSVLCDGSLPDSGTSPGTGTGGYSTGTGSATGGAGTGTGTPETGSEDDPTSTPEVIEGDRRMGCDTQGGSPLPASLLGLACLAIGRRRT